MKQSEQLQLFRIAVKTMVSLGDAATKEQTLMGFRRELEGVLHCIMIFADNSKGKMQKELIALHKFGREQSERLFNREIELYIAERSE